MNDLIRIVNTKISDAEIKTVNARELHAFLEFEFCCASRAFENHFVNSKGA